MDKPKLRTVNVKANEPLYESGKHLKKGDTLWITAKRARQLRGLVTVLSKPITKQDKEIKAFFSPENRMITSPVIRGEEIIKRKRGRPRKK